jgi:hypothetical protein
MPVRVPLVTDPAARVLLDGLVDYAGLFPPAARGMADAVRRYAGHRGGEAGWMLGRFVCGVDRLAEFAACAEPLLPRDAGALPWRLAAVGGGDVAAAAAEIARVNARHRWSAEECSAVIDVVEMKLETPDAAALAAGAFAPEVTVYLEVPPEGPLLPLLDAIARTGRRAKLRTGGVVPGAFPGAERVLDFVHGCVEARVPFKCTAGLHHALRGVHPLDASPGSARAPMHGFLNVFLAAALAAQGAPRDVTRALLDESDAGAITFHEAHIGWRGHRLDRVHLARVRAEVAISFGSCSFTEPVQELRALGAS